MNDGIQENPKYRRMYPNFSLRGKVYIVTGGGRGLGLCMAEAMTEAGAEGNTKMTPIVSIV